MDAVWDGSRLTVHCGSQMPHDLRDVVASFSETPREAVRVISADVGGAFGTKGSPLSEELEVALLAKRFECRIRWTESRTESLQNVSHARDQVIDVRDIDMPVTAESVWRTIRASSAGAQSRNAIYGTRCR